MSKSVAHDHGAQPGGHQVTVQLGGFAWQALGLESERMNVPVDELVAFAVLYYLADVDSGRISRQLDKSPSGGAPPA